MLHEILQDYILVHMACTFLK
uniref:Uncharacterized protein n=1 Tax=Rhizophora mucronata TaxID=61149 RepID=A0A2P2JNJ8_RHIMU